MKQVYYEKEDADGGEWTPSYRKDSSTAPSVAETSVEPKSGVKSRRQLCPLFAELELPDLATVESNSPVVLVLNEALR